MSGLFNQASLVLVPSGYKAGKVYSEVPTSGDGDLTFTRASSATRVNSDGLIEIPRTNFLQRSEEFEGGVWTKGTGVSVTPDTTISPDGTQDADTLTFTLGGANEFVRQSFTFVSGVTYTLSVYAKSISGNKQFDIDIFNTIGTGFTLTENWERYIYTFTPTSTLIWLDFQMRGAAVINLWGAQLEINSTATEYIPTTNSARTTFAGITQDGTSASNIPRLDYSQGSCPALLLEPQRTNLALYSQDFDDTTGWTLLSTRFTYNKVTAPNGNNDAFEFVEVASTSPKNLYGSSGNRPISTSGSTYTVSAFFKQGTRRYCGLAVGSAASGVHVFLDTTDFTITDAKRFGGNTNWVYLSSNIQSFGNGWYRLSLTFRTDSDLVLIPSIFASNVSTSTSEAPSYLGDGSTIITFGLQLEQGAYATSYIKTTSATVTRLADACSKTGISSLIGQTQGTLFAEVAITNTDGDQRVSISDGTSSNRIAIRIDNSLVQLSVVISSTVQASIGAAIISVGNVYKIAGAYKENDFVLYVNGVQIGTDTSGIISGTLSRFATDRGDGSQNFYNPIKQAIIFPTRLSNTELAELTAL